MEDSRIDDIKKMIKRYREKKIWTEESITRIVRRTARKLNHPLTEDQIDEILKDEQLPTNVSDIDENA